MSEDEILVTVLSVVLGPGLWVWWLYRLSGLRAQSARPSGLGTLCATLVGCGAVIFAVLKTAASHDVRDAPAYLFMYVVLGLAWLRLAELFFAYLGVSTRDDVVERRNGAATLAIAGALLGVACCYAGGNVGDGPGWWVVVFSAGLATLGLCAAWLLHGSLSHANDAVTIDRDPAAGLRLGAFLVACGLVLGRSVAGDWISAGATIIDFARGLPAVAILLAAAALVEKFARPTPERPRAPLMSHGLLPALLYVGLAAVLVAAFGWPA